MNEILEYIGVGLVIIVGIWIWGKMGESRSSYNSTYRDDINKRKKNN